MDVPRLDQAHVDPVVLLFAVVISIATGLLFGIVPAWRLHNTDPIHALKASSRASTEHVPGTRIREVLIAAEAAVCAALLLVASLLGTSLYNIARVDKGFTADHLIAAEMTLPNHRYNSVEKRSAFHRAALQRTSSIPGVRQAAVTSVLPLRGHDTVNLVTRPDDRRPVMERPLVLLGHKKLLKILLRRDSFEWR